MKVNNPWARALVVAVLLDKKYEPGNEIPDGELSRVFEVLDSPFQRKWIRGFVEGNVNVPIENVAYRIIAGNAFPERERGKTHYAVETLLQLAKRMVVISSAFPIARRRKRNPQIIREHTSSVSRPIMHTFFNADELEKFLIDENNKNFVAKIAAEIRKFDASRMTIEGVFEEAGIRAKRRPGQRSCVRALVEKVGFEKRSDAPIQGFQEWLYGLLE